MAADAPRLDYAPTPSLLRRKWKRLTFTAFLLLSAAAAFLFRADLRAGYARYSYLRLQSRCLNFAPPADRIVFDETVSAPSLLAGADYLNAYRTSSIDPPTALWQPQLFKDYWPTVVQPNGPPATAAVLFFHERTTPSGRRRLVYVSAWLDIWLSSHQQFMTVGLYEVDPATWNSNPLPHKPHVIAIDGFFSRGDPNQNDFGSDHKLLRVFAGQADPKDPSHFTIDYESAGQRGTLDGYLRDPVDIPDGPTSGVQLIARPGAVSRPSK